MACMKRKFGGINEARKAHARASYRIRVYWCVDCKAYHVTNGEKSRGGLERRPRL